MSYDNLNKRVCTIVTTKDVGVGIKDVLVNQDSSITILLTDGRSYTTPILKGKDALEDDSYLEELDGKADKIHTHSMGQIEGLSEEVSDLRDLIDGVDAEVQNSVKTSQLSLQDGSLTLEFPDGNFEVINEKQLAPVRGEDIFNK